MKQKIYIIALLLATVFGIDRLPAQTLCPTPAGLIATNITNNSATVTWAASSATGFYNVRYRVSPAPVTSSWIVVTVNTPYANLTGLSAATTYEYQVQKICSNSGGAASLSAWSASAYFTTLGIISTCPVPTGLFTNNITATSARVNWASTGASSYRMRYRIAGSLAWTTVNTTNTYKNLTGLISSTIYQWQVRSVCTTPAGVIVLSAFSPIATFTTLGVNACPAPTGLTSVFTGTGSVTLQWTSTGAQSYKIRYRSSTSAAWIQTTSTTNSKTITGLPANVNYEWQVQGVCTSAGVAILSPWSASAYFTSLKPLAVLPNPASDWIAVSVESNTGEEVTLTIHDFYGNVYNRQKQNAVSGQNRFNINVSNLKEGMYYAEITTSQGTSMEKFYVQH